MQFDRNVMGCYFSDRVSVNNSCSKYWFKTEDDRHKLEGLYGSNVI